MLFIDSIHFPWREILWEDTPRATGVVKENYAYCEENFYRLTRRTIPLRVIT